MLLCVVLWFAWYSLLTGQAPIHLEWELLDAEPVFELDGKMNLEIPELKMTDLTVPFGN